MEQNEPGTAPPGRRFPILILPAVFFVVAAILGSLPSPAAPRGDIVAVDASFFDTSPIRTISTELVTGEKKEKCMECHEPDEELTDVTAGKSEEGNHEKKLQHGRNNKCFHCHNPKDMATFQNRDGEPVAYKDVVETCTNCHGPQYRDWKAGIHGRRTGYFDLKRGEQLSLTCIECHDPHFPIFKPLKPAPGPHALHGRVAGSPAEHPFGTPITAVKATGTPEPSATPAETPTPEATPSPTSATPNDEQKGDTP